MGWQVTIKTQAGTMQSHRLAESRRVVALDVQFLVCVSVAVFGVALVLGECQGATIAGTSLSPSWCPRPVQPLP